MINIVGIIFKNIRKINYFVYRLQNLKLKDYLVVMTKKGLEFGKIVSITKVDKIDESFETTGLILRKANNQDFKLYHEIQKLELKSSKIIQKKIKEYKLNMKIIDTEYTFDKKKIIVYFFSDERVDFRNLLNELVSIFRNWVELKQINVRESARVTAGYGVCGKKFCCCSFLKEFKKISIQFAINQSISVSSSKLCGACGRLLCCLEYENNTYIYYNNLLPKVNDIIKTPKGSAMVIKRMTLLKQVEIIFLDHPELMPEILDIKKLNEYENIC
ncbi:MAG: stage 0 sporulation family protein [Candidatus Improbicoccus devescovinae]|nr:MAG: stage 0 sporulation family protein [Candidatus Improbicoccus devescovinae]